MTKKSSGWKCHPKTGLGLNLIVFVLIFDFLRFAREMWSALKHSVGLNGAQGPKLLGAIPST